MRSVADSGSGGQTDQAVREMKRHPVIRGDKVDCAFERVPGCEASWILASKVPSFSNRRIA
jgi:hypothetical protein